MPKPTSLAQKPNQTRLEPASSLGPTRDDEEICNGGIDSSAVKATDALLAQLSGAADAGDDRTVIATVVHHVLEHVRRDPEFLRLMLHSSLEGHSFAREYRDRHFAPLRAFLEAFVATRQGEGRFREGHPATLVRAIIGVPAHHSLVETLLPDGTAVSADETLDTYVTFILDGLRGSPSTRK